MPKKVIDMARVKELLAELDRVAEKYPHLVDRSNPSTEEDWLETLQEVFDVGKTERIAFRIPAGTLERLERHVERLQRQSPAGIEINLSDAARALILEGLDRIEKEEKKAEKDT